MKKRAPIKYTIRGVPQAVDRELRRRAAAKKQSLNQVVLGELLASTAGDRKRADFSDLVGRWTPDDAFDEIIAAQRLVDADKWK